jgi:hypothetical protein
MDLFFPPDAEMVIDARDERLKGGGKSLSQLLIPSDIKTQNPTPVVTEVRFSFDAPSVTPCKKRLGFMSKSYQIRPD